MGLAGVGVLGLGLGMAELGLALGGAGQQLEHPQVLARCTGRQRLQPAPGLLHPGQGGRQAVVHQLTRQASRRQGRLGRIHAQVDGVHRPPDLGLGQLGFKINGQRGIGGQAGPIAGVGELGMQLAAQADQQAARVVAPQQAVVERLHHPHRPAKRQRELAGDHHRDAGLVQRVGDAGTHAGDAAHRAAVATGQRDDSRAARRTGQGIHAGGLAHRAQG